MPLKRMLFCCAIVTQINERATLMSQVTPLSYETLEHGSGFSSEQCPEGFVCVAANTLRILTIQRLGEVFNQVP